MGSEFYRGYVDLCQSNKEFKKKIAKWYVIIDQ